MHLKFNLNWISLIWPRYSLESNLLFIMWWLWSWFARYLKKNLYKGLLVLYLKYRLIKSNKGFPHIRWLEYKQLKSIIMVWQWKIRLIFYKPRNNIHSYPGASHALINYKWLSGLITTDYLRIHVHNCFYWWRGSSSGTIMYNGGCGFQFTRFSI